MKSFEEPLIKEKLIVCFSPRFRGEKCTSGKKNVFVQVDTFLKKSWKHFFKHDTRLSYNMYLQKCLDSF